MKSNEELVLACREGDREALNELLTNIMPSIKSLARSLYHRRMLDQYAPWLDAEDLLQESLEAICKAIPRYDPACGASFLTFALTVSSNRLSDVIRKEFHPDRYPTLQRSAAPALVSFDAGSDVKDEVESFEARLARADRDIEERYQTPETVLIKKEDCLSVYRALSHISKRERVFLFYHFGFDGEPHTLTQTAEHFNLAAFRARIIRKDALKKMREWV